MRHRAWGLLLLVPAVTIVMAIVTAPFPAFHQHLFVAGTPDRFAATVVRAGRADARGALWVDNLVVVIWMLIVPRLLRAGVERWAPERRRRFGFWRLTPACALAGGALGLIENMIALTMIGKVAPATAETLVVTTLAWTQLALYLATCIGLVGLVVGPLLAPRVRPFMRRLFAPLDRLAGSHPHTPPDAAIASIVVPERAIDAERIGICLSGGGIRAASVAVGALRALDTPTGNERSMFRRARWLVAVSGGGYTAGGWRITRRPDGHAEPLATADSDGLFDHDHPWATTVRRRRRFLDNGALSITGGVLNGLIRMVAVLGAVFAGTFVVGCAIGRLTRTHAVHPNFPFIETSDETLLTLRELVPMRLVLPGGALLVIALAFVVAAFTRAEPRARARLVRFALVLATVGALLVLLLVAVPIGVVYGRRALRLLPFADGAEEGAGLLGLLSSLGVLGAMWGIVAAHVKRRWMRLGGVLLAVGMLLFAGKVADTYARGDDGIWASWPLPFTAGRLPVLVVALAWLVVVDSIAAHRLTLGGLYRKRLAATFALGDGAVAPLPPLSYDDEPLWPAYATADGPELVIAATAHSTAITFGGVRAYGFTFQPDRIVLHDRTDGTSASAPTVAYPTGSWWDGYPRGWLVSRSMALTGAAFASAMGRQALGTTNALLVALNLRLGAWVPNPRFPSWFVDPAQSPRVHLGYFVKELFGRYRPERDAFVYVADGGHRENLGLVELLRERPAVVCCVDASGDRPDSFQTLTEAITLAQTELDIDIDINLTRLRRGDGQLPLDCVAEGLIRYPQERGGGTARLLYGRYQVSEEAPPELLQFAASNAPFPHYSTSDQYLDETEHLHLVALGEHVGGRIRGLFEESAA